MLLGGCGTTSPPTTPITLSTIAESSGYRATATSADVEIFLDVLDNQSPYINTLTFGRTHEGIPMRVALVANPPVTSLEQRNGDKRLYALILANIHSGECCGKEASLRLMRELANKPSHRWLRNMVIMVIPNYNADGNDKVSLTNRPGQAGPVDGMGTRANAQGLDLNRDYMKLESPEARSLIRLITEWDPHAMIDLHTTDGSWHRYQLTYDVQHIPAADPALDQFMRRTMMPNVRKRLASRGFDTFYYGNFNEDHTRWQTYDHKPRFGLDYMALRGRVSILSEAYSYITFRERIDATHAFTSACLDFFASRTRKITGLIEQVDQRTVARGSSPTPEDTVPIRARIAGFNDKVTIKGYHPPSKPKVRRPFKDADDFPKPPGTPKDYQVEFFGRFEPTRSVSRPWAYLVPATESALVKQLQRHGIEMQPLGTARTARVEIYEWESLTRAEKPFQKHHLATAHMSRHQRQRTFPEDTWLVPTGQPLGNLLIYLVEPESDDGLVTWNFLDDHFKFGKEYPIIRIPQKPAWGK